MVLHVVWNTEDADIAYVVSSASLAEAAAAEEPDWNAMDQNFGDVRRSGDLEELKRQLGYWVDIESYLERIEESCGRQPASGDLAARLQALNDVDYGGETVDVDGDEITFPGDGDELDFEGGDVTVEPYWRVIYNAMNRDVPTDLRKAHCREREAGSMAWWGRLDTSIIPGHLDTLITELESRGYTVRRDLPEAH